MFTTVQIYDNIETMRIVRGVSQRQLLAECGLSKSFMDNLKKGSMPSADKLGVIAENLGVSVDYLLGVEKETPLEPIALKASKKEWIYILERMSDENLIKLRDYARLLLLSQEKGGQGDQGSRK